MEFTIFLVFYQIMIAGRISRRDYSTYDLIRFKRLKTDDYGEKRKNARDQCLRVVLPAASRG